MNFVYKLISNQVSYCSLAKHVDVISESLVTCIFCHMYLNLVNISGGSTFCKSTKIGELKMLLRKLEVKIINL
jgi:hypothetical protein